MYEQATKVLRVLFDAMILRLDVLAVKEAEHSLLQLTGPLPRDDLDQGRLLLLGLSDDVLEGAIDVPTAVVDVVQIQLQLHGNTVAPIPYARLAVPPQTASRSAGESLAVNSSATLTTCW